VPRSVIARAPTRIDFGGGWTDVPPYPERDGGCVCNVAISRFATVQIRESEQAASSGRLLTGSAEPIEGGPLVAAAVRRAGLHGAEVTLRSDFPTGAGLGGSSAAGVALQGALAVWRGDSADLDRAALAERSRDIEVVDLGVAGGRQDHYAAAFGGTLGLRFTDHVTVQRISLDEPTRRDLERRALLVYTGQSRISGDTVSAVIEAYRAGSPRVVAALARMKALAEEMIDALGGGDLDALASLVAEHWTHQRALHPAITTDRIDAIMERASTAGALGGKALGASGGGCVLLFAEDGTVDAVRNAVQPLGELVTFEVDSEGVTTESVNDRVTTGGAQWT
jgi:D-glycero-alpha-D-manno-heptose-7-phosphate kinase